MRVMVLVASVLTLVAMTGGLFMLKNTVEERRERLAALEAQIRADNRAIEILKAEWTHLSAPGRVQALSERYLALQPLQPAQIIESPSQIPPRARELMAAAPPISPPDNTSTAPAPAAQATPPRDFAARMRAAIETPEDTE